MKTLNTVGTVVVLCCCSTLGLLSGCSTPDAEGKFERFQADTEDRRGGGGNNANNTMPMGTRVDFSGMYFTSINTVLGAGNPLFMMADVQVADDLTTIDFTFQALTVDANETPREPSGDLIEAKGVPFNEDGSFEIDLGEVVVAGVANPISGSEITATLKLNGTVCGDAVFCGGVEGDVSSPLEANIDGSTFAAQRYEAGAIADVDAAVFSCSHPDLADVCAGSANNSNNANNTSTNNGTDNNQMMTGPRGRCVDGLDGTYTLTFLTGTQAGDGSPPSDVTLTIAASTDMELCYTGEVTSKTDDSVLAQVESVVLIDQGVMSYQLRDFIIPPGQSDLLPDGGMADIELLGAAWSENGACGEMKFLLTEPFELPNPGDFAMLKADDTERTIVSADATCGDIVRNEPCGLEDEAGRYRLKFLTGTQAEAGTPPTEVVLNLEANGLTCLGGNMESLVEPGTILTNVQKVDVGDNGPIVTINNFPIPPGANALLPDGGTSDIVLTSTGSAPGAFCGEMAFDLFDPFAIASPGTFAAGLEGQFDPVDAECGELPATPCETYCEMVEANCTAGNAITFTTDCMTDCAAYDATGTEGDMAGDTLQCRIYHVGVAGMEMPEVHCPHAAPDGGGVCVAEVNDTCEEYCAVVEAACVDTNAITWTADCMTDCAAYATTGMDGDMDGDTLQCRIYHAEAASMGMPDVHCPHASPSGGGVCQ